MAGHAEQIAAMAEPGRRPADAQTFRFWAMTLQHASKNKNAKLAEQAYAELDQRFGKDQRYQRVIPQWQKLLEHARMSHRPVQRPAPDRAARS